MLRILNVGKIKPVLNVLPSIQECMEKDFIPDSTYYSNGIVVINNKLNYSYIYDINTHQLNKTHGFKRLYIPYNDSLIFNTIENNIYKTNEMEKYSWKTTMIHLQTPTSNSLVCIGGDTYVYGILAKYSKYYCIGNSCFINNAKVHLTPLEYNTVWLDDANINTKIDNTMDVVINTLITSNIIQFLEMNRDKIKKLIIIDYNNMNLQTMNPHIDILQFKDKDLNTMLSIQSVNRSSNTYESVSICQCGFKPKN